MNSTGKEMCPEEITLPVWEKMGFSTAYLQKELFLLGKVWATIYMGTGLGEAGWFRRTGTDFGNGRGMILPGQCLWTVKGGARKMRKPLMDLPLPERRSLLRGISKKILLKQRFGFGKRAENSLSNREEPTQKILCNLFAGGGCWDLQSIPHRPHVLDAGLWHWVPLPCISPGAEPGGRDSCPDTNSECWGIGADLWQRSILFRGWSQFQFFFI